MEKRIKHKYNIGDVVWVFLKDGFPMSYKVEEIMFRIIRTIQNRKQGWKALTGYKLENFPTYDSFHTEDALFDSKRECVEHRFSLTEE